MKKQKVRTPSQHGAYLCIGALSLTVLLGFVGLALDLARVVLTIRDTQRALDAATLAAAATLTQRDLSGWQNTKKAALAAFSLNRIAGLDTAARRALETKAFRFSDSNAEQTPSDLGAYSRISGNSGNLALTFGRGLHCYRQTTTGWKREWYSLEKATDPSNNSTDRYCYANSVRLRARVTDVATVFIKVVGPTLIPTINLASASFVDFSQACGVPTCDSLGEEEGTSDQFGRHFRPFVPCPKI